MKRFLWTIKLSYFIFFSSHGYTCPDNIAKLIPDISIQKELDKNGIMSTFSQKGNLHLASKINTEITNIKFIGDTNPIYGSEILRIIPISNQKCDWINLYNNLRAISSMTDLQYFSQSKGHYRTLYKKSSVIHSPDNPIPKSDPIANQVPDWNRIYILQEDLTFGSNIYQADYTFDGKSINLYVTNVNTMWWLFFPLVTKNNFQIIITVIPIHEGLLFYGVATITAIDFPTLRDQGQISLSNRLNALEEWLKKRLLN